MKYSLGGHGVDFAWTLLRVFRFMDFSFFGVFLKKWTLNVIFGLLEAVMSKSKLLDFTDETTVRIESNENKS